MSRPDQQVAAMLQPVAVTVMGVLPVFLVGALAVQIRADFLLDPARLGLATTVMFAATGLLSSPMGRLVQRLGVQRGMAMAACLSALSLAGIGLADSYAVLLLALTVGGAGNALAPPAVNLSLSRAFSTHRLGLAFGVKQSSIPVATLLGGLAVPVVSLYVGWRWVLLAAAAWAAALAVRAYRRRVESGPTPFVEAESVERVLPRSALWMLTLGGGLGAAAATSLGVFFVDSAVRAGLGASAAGLWFAACSALGLVARVIFGWAIDRAPRRDVYVLMANLLAFGAFGYAMLGEGSQVAVVLGSLLAYGAGWAWTGLFHYSVVRANRAAAASSTGFVQTGLSFGSATGPMVFGLVAHTASYQSAWFGASLVTLLAALAVRKVRRMLSA